MKWKRFTEEQIIRVLREHGLTAQGHPVLASHLHQIGGVIRVCEDSLSGTVNKYLRENGLLKTADHSLYGLRHSFGDRMLAARIDERIRRDLMGYALGRERYGEGGGLSQVRDLLAPMSF